MSAARSIRHGTALLERDSERAGLSRLLARARTGDGGIVAICGPTGIGKSALLDALVTEATELDFEILRAHGHALEHEFSFGAVLQLYERFCDRPDLFTGAARLARGLLEPADEGRVRPDGFSVIHSLYWLTARLADEAPLLIVVDDAQWVDDSSLRHLAYLASRLDGLRVAVALGVGTSDELPSAVVGLLDEVRDSTITPAPLSPRAVAVLTAEAVTAATDRLAADCHRLTGGNPLLVIESLRETAVAVGQPIPPLRPGVRRRIRELDRNARTLLTAAAVLEEAPLAVVAEVSDLEPAEATRAVRSLRTLALVDPGDPVRPTHALVREALELEVAVEERAGLRQRAFEVLRRAGAADEVLAAHARLMTPQGSAEVVDALHRAADRSVAAGAPADAVLDLRRALEEPPPEASRAELLVDLAQAEALAGDPAAEAHLHDALRAYAHECEQQARARLRIGTAYYSVGELRAAADHFDAGLMAIEDPSSELALRLLAGFAQSTLVDVTNQQSVHARVEAALGPDPSGATRAERDLLRFLAYARALRDGTRKEVLDLAHCAMRPEVRTERELLSAATFVPGVLALMFADDEVVLPQLLDEVCDRALALGQLAYLAGASNYRGSVRLWRGQVDDALADLMLAREGATTGWGGILPGISGSLAIAHLVRGDVVAAEEALVLPPTRHALRDSASFNAYLWGRARARVAKGELAAALDDLRECGERQRDIGALNPATIPWQFDIAHVLHVLNRDDEARDLVDEALAYARRFDAPRTLAHGLRAAAALERGERRLPLLREAVEVIEATPWILEYCDSSLAFGRALVASGRAKDGRTQLQAALDLAHRCGALRNETAALEALQSTGARPRRRRVTGPESLTAAERVIARLAASGLTNREIAEQRFVTVKAVEFHLGNAYRKLGITSRRELRSTLDVVPASA